MDLQDRHVVVTGAAGGIGSALARRFHAAGARVVLADQRSPDSVAAELPGSIALAVDLSTEAGNIELIDTAEREFGIVDLFLQTLVLRLEPTQWTTKRSGTFPLRSTRMHTGGQLADCCQPGSTGEKAISARRRRLQASSPRSGRRRIPSPNTLLSHSQSGCQLPTASVASR